MQQSALLLALKYVADNREEFLNNFALKAKRSVAKAKTEGPAAWIIPTTASAPPSPRNWPACCSSRGPRFTASIVKPRSRLPSPRPPGHGRPRHPEASPAPEPKAEAPKPQAQKVAAGSYVVRMDQPYSRMVDMMLDTQYYSTADPRPYDDTGWTFGPLRNVATLRVVDPSILDCSDDARRTARPAQTGSVVGNGSAYFVLNATAEPALATLRFRLKNVSFFAAEEPFEVEGVKFNAGSFLIPTSG